MTVVSIGKVIGKVIQQCVSHNCPYPVTNILTIQSGPDKGNIYYICDECFKDLKQKVPMTPLGVN